MKLDCTAKLKEVDAGRRSGRKWRDAVDAPLMVDLPTGEFIMGENDGDKFANDTERPAHAVRIFPGLALGCFPVTVGQFRHFHPGHSAEESEELPVVNVNWHEAREFCGWLTDWTGRSYRLPSEAEWEFACRAGSRTPFAGGDEIAPQEANFLHDESGARVGVGHRTRSGCYPANAFGLCDLHGNVNEWIEDAWHVNYVGAPSDGRGWAMPGDRRRVVRGGAWDYMPRLLRSAWRDWRAADHRADNIGFRVATNDLKLPAIE